MSTKYEYNDTEILESYYIISGDYTAQTIKPSTAHVLTSVKFKGYRTGTIGPITISLLATSNGVPTGGSLATGTYDGNLLPVSLNGVPPGGSAWFEVPMSSYTLQANTTYALSIFCAEYGPGNYLDIKATSSGDPYPNGSVFYSTDGINWDEGGGNDILFEDW